MRVTYLDDIADAAARAKEASVVPVLFGDGHRMFQPREAKQTELEVTRVLEGENVTHIRYRVRPGDEA